MNIKRGENLVNFINSSGSVTITVALITLIGIGINIFINTRNINKQIKADVVSKARIEWIQKVRNETAAFITNCYQYLDFFPSRILTSRLLSNDEIEVLRTSEKSKNIRAEIAIEIEDTKIPFNAEVAYKEIDVEKFKLENKILKSWNLLVLYFGPDDAGENLKIIEKIKKIGESVKKEEVDKIENLVSSFKEEMRIYLKVEWKRANGSIKDNDVSKEVERLRKLAEDQVNVEEDKVLIEIGENSEVLYNPEIMETLKKHKIKGFFYKKFGWFKKQFEIEESRNYFDYDKIFVKFSVFFKNEKYNVNYLEKLIFFIERKIENHTDSGPKMVDFKNACLAFFAIFLAYMAIYANVIPNELLISINKYLPLGVDLIKYVIVLLSIFFIGYIIANILSVTEKNMLINKREIINTKKKYLLIINCLNKEIERRKE